MMKPFNRQYDQIGHSAGFFMVIIENCHFLCLFKKQCYQTVTQNHYNGHKNRLLFFDTRVIHFKIFKGNEKTYWRKEK